MAPPNNSTAQAQIALMIQVIDENIETSQNLDQGIDRRFQMATARDMGKEKYRHPIEFDVGGQFAFYDPDGGPYIQGNGPGYNQFIVVPVAGIMGVARTELLARIEGAGTDRLLIAKPIARMLARMKDKFAHTRNALAQGYNQGLLATVDASYAGGTVVQLANVPYGNRLLDINNQYAACDANFNIVGTVTVLQKSNSTGGGVDTITIDAVPPGLAAGYQFIPMNSASGAPLGPQGLEYLISNSTNGDNCGIARTVPYVVAPSVNASSTLTLGIIEVMNQRQNQALGSDQEAEKRFYYTHYVQRATARLLGFAKVMLTQSDGKTPMFDIAAPRNAPWMIGNQEVLTDSMAGVDKLYDVAQGQLRKVRYPGSQKMIPGLLEGIWWPRYSNGQATSESDALFQDAYNFYTKLPWAHVYAYNLYVNPVMAAGT